MDLLSLIREAIPSVKDEDILRTEVDGKFVYEVTNVPTSREVRGRLNEALKDKLEEQFPDSAAKLVGSVRIGGKTYSSKAKVLRVTEGEQRGAPILGVIKLNPRPKLVLTPKLFGVTKSSGPDTVGSYLSISQIISTIKSKLDELKDSEKISNSLYDWVNENLDYFNPQSSSNNASKIRSSWGGSGLEDEVSSEMLELFCALAYIKFIQKGTSGPNTRISSAERNRVKQILGKSSIPSDSNSFKIWYPSASNFPIIDCQVGYFEGGQLKAVFPISTKNVTGGRQPNVIKFGDIFKDTKGVNAWKDHLPREILKEQQYQYRVAHSAIKDKSTLYPALAAETLLNSTQRNSFMSEVNRYANSSEVRATPEVIKKIADKISKNVRNRKAKLDNISLGPNLQMAKKLVCVLIQKTSTGGGSSPYKQVMTNSRFTIETLSQMNEQQWNSTVKRQYTRANYPFTVENVSLFFEKVLENSSVFKGGRYDYDQVVKRAYFSGNKVLQSKYKSPISGAGDVIIAKVDIRNDGMINIAMDTSSTTANRTGYGLRSKNSFNNLQDALGITP